MNDEKPFITHIPIELPGYEIDLEFKEKYEGPKVIELGILRTTPDRIYGLMRRQLMEFNRTSDKLDGFDITENRTIESDIYLIGKDRNWGCIRVRVTPINDIEAVVTLNCAALSFDKYWAKIYYESMEFIELFATYLRKIFRLPISNISISFDEPSADANPEEMGISPKKNKNEDNKQKVRRVRRDAVERVALAIFLFENEKAPTWVSAANRARTTVPTINQLENNDKVKSLLTLFKSNPKEVIRIKQKVAYKANKIPSK